MSGIIAKKNSCLQPMTVLNLEERRLFTFCLQFYDSRPGAENPETFTIPLDQFRSAYPEYSQKKPSYIFQVVKAAINGIQQKPYQPDPEKKRVIWWFSALEVDEKTITFSLTKQVMPFFLDIRDRFIRYKMVDVERLVKPNAWTLFEYCKEKYMNGLCPTWTVPVDELKDRLGVMDKYKRFGDFDTRCLKQPVQDINETTDLVVEYTKQKKGVRVVAIRFDVKTKSPDPDTIDIENLSLLFTREQLRHGISENVATRNTKQAEKLGNLAECIAKVQSAHDSWQKHGKGPFSGYLAKVLTNELFQRDLFNEPVKVQGSTDFSAYSDTDLDVFMKAAPGYREDILREKKKRGLI
jgi:plasmid replication initiation protein